MNKTLFLIFCICGFLQLESVEKKLLNKTEVRGAAFMPASEQFRNLYGNVLPSLQIEQARGFKNVPYLEVWGNFEWIFSNGEASHSCGKSTIDIINISLGPKGIGPVYRDRIYLYAGVGPDLAITFIEDRINCCQDCADSRKYTHNCNVGVGVIGKTGCQIFATPHFYFDLFADYLYLPMQFHNTKDIGGLKAGLGLSGKY